MRRPPDLRPMRRTTPWQPVQDTRPGPDADLPTCPTCGSGDVVPMQARDLNWTAFACVKCARRWSHPHGK